MAETVSALSPRLGAQPRIGSALGRGQAGAPATANRPALLLVFKCCSAWPDLAISRPIPGDHPALPVLGKRSVLEHQSPSEKGLAGARPGPGLLVPQSQQR